MAGDITTIARPYAEAVFARARESDSLDAWTQALELFAAIAGDTAMADKIVNPNIPRERVRDLILDIAGADLVPEARNLLMLLTEKNRLVLLPEIARLFEGLKTRERGVRHVHIRSAYAVDAAQQQRLAEALKSKLNADIELTVEKDPALIGGVEIRAGDLVIDASIRGKLETLAAELRT